MQSSSNRGPTPYDAKKKSLGISYLLWFFLGVFGAHRFYIGHAAVGIVMLLMGIVGIVTASMGVNYSFIGGVALWMLADAFFLPFFVRKHNARLASVRE